jgi:hypothetical protein
MEHVLREGCTWSVHQCPTRPVSVKFQRFKRKMGNPHEDVAENRGPPFFNWELGRGVNPLVLDRTLSVVRV